MENIIIIGAGPAGISAALYAARGNMDPLIINTGIGSLEKAEKIENYYGLEQPLSGRELFERGLAQARALGVRILDAQVVGMGGFDTFEVKTTAGDFEARSVILATGSRRASARPWPGSPAIRVRIPASSPGRGRSTTSPPAVEPALKSPFIYYFFQSS